MFKVAWFARFSQRTTKTDARLHWAKIHGPMCQRVPGIERYVQNHVIGALPTVSGTSDQATLFDSYSCGWWADRDGLQGVDGDARVGEARRGRRQRLRHGMALEHERSGGRASHDRGPDEPVQGRLDREIQGRHEPRRRAPRTGRGSMARFSRSSTSTATCRTTSSAPSPRTSAEATRSRKDSTASRSAGSRAREQFLRAIRVPNMGEGCRGWLKSLRHDQPVGCAAGRAGRQGPTLKPA